MSNLDDEYLDDDFSDETARSYLLGPVTLDEWIDYSLEAAILFERFSEEHPDLDVNKYTIVTDYPDTFYIRIDIRPKK